MNSIFAVISNQLMIEDLYSASFIQVKGNGSSTLTNSFINKIPFNNFLKSLPLPKTEQKPTNLNYQPLF
jgi:hypothetical protein